MPRSASQIRALERKRKAAVEAIYGRLDRPKTKPRPKQDPNAWKKQHITDSGVPRTLVARYDGKVKSKRKKRT